MTPEIRHALNKGFKATAKGTIYYDPGESWNALKAELNRRAPSPIISADWKLVLVDPMREMILAGERSPQKRSGVGVMISELVYRAMLAAAPPAPALDEARDAFEAWWEARQCASYAPHQVGPDYREFSPDWGRSFKPAALDAWLAAKRHARGEATTAPAAQSTLPQTLG